MSPFALSDTLINYLYSPNITYIKPSSFWARFQFIEASVSLTFKCGGEERSFSYARGSPETEENLSRKQYGSLVG